MSINESSLDFSYKIDGEKYTLKDCDGDMGIFRYKTHKLLNAIYRKYQDAGKIQELHSMVKEEDFSSDIISRYANWTTENAELQTIRNSPVCALKHVLTLPLGMEDPSITGMIHHNTAYLYRELMSKVLTRTQEYAEASNLFKEWIKTRPAVAKAWREYAVKKNVSYDNNPSYNDVARLPLELDLVTLADNVNNAGFRRILEHNRADKFSAGQVVKLKSMFLNKRGKDPFFYKYEKEYKSAERIGTVLKKEKIDYHGNYGVGSREIRVLWFMSGEETRIQEKCLSLVKED